jgi:hypothetical protein
MKTALITSSLLLLASCTSDGAQSGSQNLSGPIDVRIMAPPAAGDVTEIVVTIDRIEAQTSDDQWVSVMEGTRTIDLAAIEADALPTLGIVKLPAGTTTRLRLHVSDTQPRYVLLSDGTKHDLVTPAGVQSGIKVYGDLSLRECEVGHVTLKFDENGIFVHEATTDKWILRPVIRVVEVTTSTPPC